MFKNAVIAATIIAGAVTGAEAATVSGTYNIDIYNYNAGGSSAAADATAANVAANSGNLLASITYVGALDFLTGGGTLPTIEEFLNSGGGTYDHTGLGVLMSAGGFGTTTLLDITGTFLTAVLGTITHDDGVTLYDTTGIVLDSASPTSPRPDAFAAGAGNFRLIYSAANGNPEQLNVDATPAAVPLPAAGLLLIGGIGALGAMKRRRAA